MIDVDKFKENILNLGEERDDNYARVARVYLEFFTKSCATEVDFESFAYKDTLLALEEIEEYTVDEEVFDYDNNDVNRGNLLHKFTEIDHLAWLKIFNLPPRVSEIEYI